LLAMQTETLTLERLGMKEADLDAFRRAIALPHGIVLLTGPTGSGKTTTLYAALRKLLAEEALNVITVEDPIEYEIPGVSQVEVDSADKVSFVKALRSVLRHDPDVLMIGEIRDADTADVAIKASLTGHLVFSTLHTNSATNVVTRLTDIGVDRYLIAATLRLAVAQRLVRRLCQRCRKPRPLTEPEARLFGSPSAAGREVFDAVGCLYCGGRGYTGRIGLFEVWPIDESTTRAIGAGATEGDLTASAIAAGCSTLKTDALGKLLAGDVSTRDALSAIIEW
jgi:general secretion pathway protein E